MKHILCFGDSNTYDLIPKEGGRYPWGIRWISILTLIIHWMLEFFKHLF